MSGYSRAVLSKKGTTLLKALSRERSGPRDFGPTDRTTLLGLRLRLLAGAGGLGGGGRAGANLGTDGAGFGTGKGGHSGGGLGGHGGILILVVTNVPYILVNTPANLELPYHG